MTTETPEGFAEELEAGGLRQADFYHLQRHFGGAADRVTINRWAKGTRPAPPNARLVLRLWREIPARRRAELLEAARIDRRRKAADTARSG